MGKRRSQLPQNSNFLCIFPIQPVLAYFWMSIIGSVLKLELASSLHVVVFCLSLSFVFRKWKFIFEQVDSLQLCCEKSCCFLRNGSPDSGVSTVHHFGYPVSLSTISADDCIPPIAHPFPVPPAALYLLEPQLGLSWWTELCIANTRFWVSLF